MKASSGQTLCETHSYQNWTPIFKTWPSSVIVHTDHKKEETPKHTALASATRPSDFRINVLWSVKEYKIKYIIPVLIPNGPHQSL